MIEIYIKPAFYSKSFFSIGVLCFNLKKWWFNYQTSPIIFNFFAIVSSWRGMWWCIRGKFCPFHLCQVWLMLVQCCWPRNMSGARFLTTSKCNILQLPFTWYFGTTKSNVPYNLNSLLQTFLNRLEEKLRSYSLLSLPKYII